MKIELPPLYPIVNVTGTGDEAIADAMDLALRLAGHGQTLLQLRAKELGAGAFTELAVDLVSRLSPLGCKLIVNDRVDVAMAAAAAGVHVGDQDLPVGEVRRLLGDEAVVGFSTHSVDEIEAAADSGADHVGFGPVFESPTKTGARDPRGLETLARACSASRLPVVAIGGVSLETAPRAWAAGAASVAVISEIERATDLPALLAGYQQAAQQAGLGRKPE